MANQEESDTKHCSNCMREIPSINFVMHQTHCQRNIKLCEHCKEPVPTSEMQNHFEEEHKQVPCKCGESVEISKLEEHEKKDCKNRSVNCEYCDIDLPFSKIQDHKDFCGSRTELCDLCKRYIQLKDLDVHMATECTYPEMPPKPTTRSSPDDESDGFHMLNPGWQGTFPQDHHMQFLTGNPLRTATHMFPHLISPTRGWNPQAQVEQLVAGDRRRTSGTDRRHRKNQDRVQNSFGVTGKKKGSSSSSAASRLSRPWEKNDERQQNLSQEESDRLLAMHLAQDLTGSRLSPGEHPSLFSAKSDMLGISQAEINDMLKQAYDIPTVNSFQEPKHTQASPADNSTMLPCEFCQEPFPPEILIEHMSGCRPDVASFPSPSKPSAANNKRQAPPSQGLSLGPQVLDNLGQGMSQQWMPAGSSEPENKSPGDTDDDSSVMLPCEFCGDLLPFDFLAHHQVNCTDNGTNTPLPPDSDSISSIRNPIASSPTSIRPRRLPIPTTLGVHPRPVKHQAAPSLDVLMSSPDSKPTKDSETNPRPRQANQPRNRKTKVSSTVTRPGGHGVNVTSASPVDKYMNGSLYDRDGKVAKPRVASGEKKIRGERPHSKSTRGQQLVHKANDEEEDVDVISIDKDFDEEVTPLFRAEPKGKPTLAASFNPSLQSPQKDLNNRKKPVSSTGKPRAKAIKKSNLESGEVSYEPSFGAREDRPRVSREKNNRPANKKPSNKSRHAVNLESDDDLGPPLRLSKSSNHTSGGAKPKNKKASRKPDGDLV